MASQTSISSSSSKQYHVFLSFRGPDTRNKFISHLYEALRQRVRTFKDNIEIQAGEEITQALLNAIQESRISIPVFSKGYASSKCCLLELAEIYKCHKKSGQVVLPIFFDVEPSDVKKQTGSFMEAFANHEKEFNPTIVKKWRKALKEVGKLKGGWDLAKDFNGDESKLLKSVVERVMSEVKIIPFRLAEHPVGLESRVGKVLSLLSLESNNSKYVGIWGMGGIGKTTIAKHVYFRIFEHFQCMCYLSDVREQSKRGHGLISLQEQLLKDTFNIRVEERINNIEQGSILIEVKLQGKKVLLILDDVDDHEQLKALAGNLNWFGSGSRIIITTRDKKVLELGHVDSSSIYEPEELDEKQSLELFSMYAFERREPDEDYMPLSKKVVSYARGVPLTLEVLGCDLHNVVEKEQWEETLQKLKKILPDDVQKKLKISYDKLGNTEKYIFLDIACFFIGMEKESAIEIWKSCEFYPYTGLNVLTQKSLVRIDEYNLLLMHDHVRDMGRKIVRKKDAGKCSRLWSQKEVIKVLTEHKGTRKVEGIFLDFWGKGFNSYIPQEIMDPSVIYYQIKIEDFVKMSNLRLLLVSGVDIKGNFECLPSTLRWFCWRCPLDILPSNFYMAELVVLNLSCSIFRQAWNSGHENMRFENLKVLNLRDCYNLVKSPDFSGFPRLEKLLLSSCENLVDVHKSIGKLNRLEYLNMDCCFNLKELPESFGGLISLKRLSLDWTHIQRVPNSIKKLSAMEHFSMSGRRRKFMSVSQIKGIPKSFWKIESLVDITLDDLDFKKIPDVIGKLTKLERLHVTGCSKLESLPQLPSSLIFLDASGCSRLRRLSNLSNLKNLQTLLLNGCSELTEIQDSFNDPSVSFCENGKLTKLEILRVAGCSKLEFLPQLPSSLICLNASGCFRLKRLSNLKNLKNLKTLLLNGCSELAEIQGLEEIESLEKLDLRRCYTHTDSLTCKLVKDSFNHRSVSFFELGKRYVIGEDLINKEIILCIVVKLQKLPPLNSDEEEMEFQDSDLEEMTFEDREEMDYEDYDEEEMIFEDREDIDYKESDQEDRDYEDSDFEEMIFEDREDLDYEDSDQEEMDYEDSDQEVIDYEDSDLEEMVLEAPEDIDDLDPDEELCCHENTIRFDIHRNGRQINCRGSLPITNLQMGKSYIYHFRGRSWFGFRLNVEDEIEIGYVGWVPPNKMLANVDVFFPPKDFFDGGSDHTSPIDSQDEPPSREEQTVSMTENHILLKPKRSPISSKKTRKRKSMSNIRPTQKAQISFKAHGHLKFLWKGRIWFWSKGVHRNHPRPSRLKAWNCRSK